MAFFFFFFSYGVLLPAGGNPDDLVADPGLAFTLAQYLCRSCFGVHSSLKSKSVTLEPPPEWLYSVGREEAADHEDSSEGHRPE